MRGGGKSTFPKPTPDRRARIEFVEREGRKESVFWFLLLSLGLHTFEWRRSVPKFVMQIYDVRSEGKGGGRAPFRTYVRPLIPSEVEEGYPARAGDPFGTGSAYGGGQGEIGQTFFQSVRRFLYLPVNTHGELLERK